jgi:glucokinase
METVFRAADKLLDEASAQAGSPVSLCGIGVSAAGCVDKDRGAIAKNGGNVPDWSHTEVASLLCERYGVTATLVNDGNAVALAEQCVGAASGSDDVLCIVIGTGIGGGIISGGRLLEGNRGFAGEIGHFPVHIGEKTLEEGGKGVYFENRASTAGLVREAVLVNSEWDNGRKVFEAAERGDERALALLDHWLDELTYGITGLIHVLNPAVVLIGGGVSAQYDLLVSPLRRKVLATIKPDFTEDLEIKAASLGNDAGMIGAVCYFIDSQNTEEGYIRY